MKLHIITAYSRNQVYQYAYVLVLASLWRVDGLVVEAWFLVATSLCF